MNRNQALAWRWRRLLAALQRLRGSLSQRGFRGTWRRIEQEFRPIRPRALATALLPLDWTFAPFALSTVGEPEV